MRLLTLTACLAVAAAQPLLAATDTAVLRTQEGTAALLRGKFDQALTAFDAAIADPDLPAAKLAGAHSDRGVAYWRLGRNPEALKDFNRSIELFNGSASTYNNRANVFLDLGRYDDAVADLDKAISLAPAYGAAYNNRGNANFQLGRYEAALADYRRAVELLPTNAVPYNGRAQAQEALGRPYAGLRYITRAISLNGKYTAAYRNRALILAHLDRDDDALADFERLINLAPEDAYLYIGRGQVLLKQKKVQPALKDFSKAIELDAQNATAYMGRGAVNNERKKYDEALADLDQAITLDPKLGEAYRHRAEAQFRLNNIERAEADLAKALEFVPNYADAYKLRGDIAQSKNDTEAAIAAYRQAIQFDPFIEGVAETLKKLTNVEELRQTIGLSVKGWDVISPSKGRFVAVNPAHPKLKVLLEMHGDGEPAVLDWTPLSDNLRGYGLLRYSGGMMPGGKSEPSRYEFVAIIDLNKNNVVAIEPYLAGETQAKWEWSPTGVVVTDAEGVTSAHELRPPKPKPASPPVAQDQPWFNGGGWDRGYGNGGRRPRGLFDWLFN